MARATFRSLAPLALLALVGCKFGWSDTGEDEDRAIKTRSYDYEASSLILSDDGTTAVMATANGVVVFDTTSGDASATTPAEDFIAPEVEDWVDSKVAIVDRSADAGVYLWEPGELSYELREDEEAQANASNARGFSGGLAWIGRKAENCRILRDGLDLTTIEPCGYIRDLAIIPSDGTLFLGYDDDQGALTVLRIDPDGTQTHLDVPMDLLSWDDTRKVLYTATADSSSVAAVTKDGGPVFSVKVEGEIADLVALEREGLLAVLVLQGSEAFVHIVDQYSGELLTSLDAAPSSVSLVASGDSSTLAILQADRMAILTLDWDRVLNPDTGE